MAYFTLVKRGYEVTATTSSFSSLAEAVEQARYEIADIEDLKESSFNGRPYK